MAKRRVQQPGEKLLLTDVKVVDVQNVPPRYFSRPAVLAALEREIRFDVVHLKRRRIPEGCEPRYLPAASIRAQAHRKLSTKRWQQSRVMVRYMVLALAFFIAGYALAGGF